MRLSKTQIALYIGIHRNHVNKHIQVYKDILNTKRKYLTIYDIAKVDDIEPSKVLKIIYNK